MKYKAPGKCPVCGEKLEITKLNCPNCSTSIEGEFKPCQFCRLPKDELEFINIFIMSRGNIKDVEKELGISYPTVRSKLDSVIKSLGLQDESKRRSERRESVSLKMDSLKELKELKQEILDQLASGELTAKEAMERIKELKI
ncbi:hypothetical protein SH1V18_29590 [Vallitalea longa]|uniref:DUF2089 domain-containing protein n=1 Tax=Vallitalea longa TaxID=2936439 RepID=A0A9W5YCA3_9FIRM|nr:DUF2089 domain-containing protein [Vallitalea longa]GKX30479.1 hypothetical protein SH1V18_29590 [Vallitalea longa]